MKRKELFSMIGVILVSIGTVFLFSGCVTDFNGLFFGKEDTSVNWEMTAVDKVPSLNQLEKLSNLSKEASAIYRYADMQIEHMRKVINGINLRHLKKRKKNITHIKKQMAILIYGKYTRSDKKINESV